MKSIINLLLSTIFFATAYGFENQPIIKTYLPRCATIEISISQKPAPGTVVRVSAQKASKHVANNLINAILFEAPEENYELFDFQIHFLSPGYSTLKIEKTAHCQASISLQDEYLIKMNQMYSIITNKKVLRSLLRDSTGIAILYGNEKTHQALEQAGNPLGYQPGQYLESLRNLISAESSNIATDDKIAMAYSLLKH